MSQRRSPQQVGEIFPVDAQRVGLPWGVKHRGTLGAQAHKGGGGGRRGVGRRVVGAAGEDDLCGREGCGLGVGVGGRGAGGVDGWEAE